MDESGWTQSADAWIASMGAAGDKGRRHVIDPALKARFAAGGFARALDLGCGEGRVCRMMQGFGIATVGIDPTEAMIARARQLDPAGDYRVMGAEALDLPAALFDLVVSCLTMIDIPDFRAAIAECARVLTPGGTFIVANLTPMQTAGMGRGWRYDEDGRPLAFEIDDYMREWAEWVAWSGIRVRNWHRPLSAYMQAYLKAGLTLESYEDLMPVEGYVDEDSRYARVPWFDMMAWRKPAEFQRSTM